VRRPILVGGMAAGAVAIAIGAAVLGPSMAPSTDLAPQASHDTAAVQSPLVAAPAVIAVPTPTPRSTQAMSVAETTAATPVEGKWTPAMAEGRATPAGASGGSVDRDPRTAAFVIMQPYPTPTPPATATATLEDGRVGLQIQSPADGAQVPPSAVIRGNQRRPTPPGRHLWAFVKAVVPDARWYAWHRGEILPGVDNAWGIDLYLGGTTGTRHEVRIGTVDDARHAELSTVLATYPDQPLPDLPADFVQEAQVTVTLE
jgi:hypothetical protein